MSEHEPPFPSPASFDPGQAEPDPESELDEVTDEQLAAESVEIRARITEGPLGIIDDDAWGSMVATVLDEHWPEEGG